MPWPVVEHLAEQLGIEDASCVKRYMERRQTVYDHAVGWLRRNRVLLPGVSVLAREVAEVRRIAEKRLHTMVAKAAWRADPSLAGDLVALLKTPEGKRYSYLEQLRRPPTRTTGTAMKNALQRVDEIAAYRLGRVKLNKVPPKPRGASVCCTPPSPLPATAAVLARHPR
ncbi:hypothetical protein VR41_12375 [Streptomyces sp. NRRL B-1568]|nr:hypothetical protein VR41_12375 [Streptomyces sp. NRRL B-1568]